MNHVIERVDVTNGSNTVDAASSWQRFKFWWPTLAVALFGACATFWVAWHQQTANMAVAQQRFRAEVQASARALGARVTGYAAVVSPVRLGGEGQAWAGLTLPQAADASLLFPQYPEIERLSLAPRDVLTAAPGHRAGPGWADHVFLPALPGAGGGARWLEVGRHLFGAASLMIDVPRLLQAAAASGALRGLAVRVLAPAPDQVPQGTAATVLATYRPPAGVAGACATCPSLSESSELNVLGQRWQLQFTAVEPLLSATERRLPTTEIAVGGLLTLIFVSLAGWLSWQRRRVRAYLDAAFESVAAGGAIMGIASDHWRRLGGGELHQSARRLRQILDHLPLALILITHDGRIIFRNARFQSLLGYTERDVPDVGSWWRRAYPDARTQDEARKRWQRALEHARGNLHAADPYETKVLCHDGVSRVVECTCALIAEGIVLTLADLSQQKEAQERIEYLAYYDPLTRLPNRQFLLQRSSMVCDQGERSHWWGVLVLLDVDRFKVLNATQGRHCGDLLLNEIASRLFFDLRGRHIVARSGDDEFVVVLDALAEQFDAAMAQAAEEVERLQKMLSLPYFLDGVPYHTSLSAGIAHFQGDRMDMDELLRHAALGVSQAEACGRGQFRFYDAQAQALIDHQAQLESDLREGLRQEEFVLYYQPQVRADVVVGAEALIRWHHPRRGVILPGAFIALAEETGLILPLGGWALQAACRQLARWAQQPPLRHLTLSVNVSPQQFYQQDFVSQVLETLDASGVDPAHLRLEITEGVLLRDVEATVVKMSRLREHGVNFSLDDFGTGYSSLGYLRRLPMAELKIDQSFVRDVLTDASSAAIARAIMNLGRDLGLHVVAEGVETQEQRDFLKGIGCDTWQGYLLSRPVAVQAFEYLVSGRCSDAT